jgi:hypothetical protein
MKGKVLITRRHIDNCNKNFGSFSCSSIMPSDVSVVHVAKPVPGNVRLEKNGMTDADVNSPWLNLHTILQFSKCRYQSVGCAIARNHKNQ